MTTNSYESFLMDDLKTKDRYFLMTACIVPRPIAFVTSLNSAGDKVNAAPFSFFNGVSSNPPLIMLGLGAKPGPERGTLLRKDTTNNIADTGEFVVNICNVAMVQAVEASSEPHPPEISEVDHLGLTTIASDLVKPPRLADSPVQFECRLYQAIQLGPGKATLILGEVLKTHIRADLWKDGRVDTAGIDPLARVQAGRYANIGRIFKPDEA